MLNGCFFECKSVLRKSSKAVEHGKFGSLVLKTSPHACITDTILQDLTVFINSFHIPQSSIFLLPPGLSLCFPAWRKKLLGSGYPLITNLVLAFLWGNWCTAGSPTPFPIPTSSLPCNTVDMPTPLLKMYSSRPVTYTWENPIAFFPTLFSLPSLQHVALFATPYFFCPCGSECQLSSWLHHSIFSPGNNEGDDMTYLVGVCG